MFKKMNNKGYMLVEMVLASVLAFSVAYYLLNLTYKFKDKSMVVYESTELLSAKINITKNIMNDLGHYYSVEIVGTPTADFVDLKAMRIDSDAGSSGENLRIRKGKDASSSFIEYGKWDGTKFIKNDFYYKKKLPPFVEVKDIEVIEKKSIRIPIRSIYDDNNYDIKLYVFKDEPFVPVIEYMYKGSVQEFKAVKAGYYKIEAWGAQGGNSSNSTLGGKGSKTEGYIELNENESLYLCIGSQPSVTSSARYSSGGYNGGGGSGYYSVNSNNFSRGGGGATDIRLVSGDCNAASSLNSRIMVAAGGGGSVIGDNNNKYNGAPGGYLVGVSGISNYKADNPYGGNQTSGGIGVNSNGINRNAGFGVGGNISNPSQSGWGGGGGSGYYGGAAGFGFPGASGSSFISGYAGANAITYPNTRTHTNNTRYGTTKYFIHGKMFSGVREGNGKVRISYIGATKPTRVNPKLNGVKYIKSCSNGNTTNNGNHWVEIQAIKDGLNVAKGKSVTGTVPQDTSKGSAHLYSNIVDGLIDNIDGSSGYGYSTTQGFQCVTVNLGNSYDLDEIAVWLWWKDNRAYKDYKVEVSNDGVNYSTITNDNGIETSDGFRVSAYEPEGKKKVRFHRVGGSILNDPNLISKYDGYYNSNIEEHSNTTTTWSAMSGNKHGNIYNGVWSDDDGALEFNGSNTCVNLGIMNSNYQTIEATFSIENKKESGSADRQYIIGNWDGGGGGIYVNSPKDGEYIVGEFYIAGKWQSVISNVVPIEGKKYHVAVTYNGTNIILYINGRVAGSSPKVEGTITVPSNSTVMSMGNNPSGNACSEAPASTLDGKIYDAAVYSRALSPIEISDNYEKTVSIGTLLADISPKVLMNGYNFSGWQTESGREIDTETTIISEDLDLYPRWSN